MLQTSWPASSEAQLYQVAFFIELSGREQRFPTSYPPVGPRDAGFAASASRRKRRHALTLIELLVVFGVVSILAALLLPAVQHAREAARAMSCRSQLRQIGMALHNYNSTFGTFAPGAITRQGLIGVPTRDSFAPWSVMILPYLGDGALADEFVFEETFFGLWHASVPAENQGAQLRRNSMFECPSDPNSNGDNANCNYFGVQGGGRKPDITGSAGYEGRVFFFNGMFRHNSSVRYADVPDGASQTIAVGETKYLQLEGGGTTTSGLFYGTWASSFWTSGTSPSNLSSLAVTLAAAVEPINNVQRNPARDWTVEHQSRTFGSYHADGCHFLLLDGSVHFVSQAIDLDVYHSLGDRRDGRPLGVLP